jgi:hypothetical protein
LIIGGSNATGLITVNQYSGFNSALTNLTLENRGSGSNGGIIISGALSNLRNLILSSKGSIVLNANIASSGSQTYDGAVTLGADVILTASTVITESTVSGDGSALRIVGNAVFGESAGDTLTGLSALIVSGTTSIKTDAISTSGVQAYGGAVTLNADTNLTASITSFEGEVSGAYSLAITGNAVFGNGSSDRVSLTGRNKTLSVSGDATINANITTSGSQNYIGAVTLGNSITIRADSISAGSISTNGKSIEMNANNFINISGPINTSARPSSSGDANDGGDVTINAGGALTLFGITTNGGDSSYTSLGRYYSSRDRRWYDDNNSYDGGDAGNISLAGSTIYLGGNVNAVGGLSNTGDSGKGGSITFESPLVLLGDSAILSTGRTDGVVSFKSTVDGSSTTPQATFY